MAWDRDLMYQLEERIAGEFVGKGVNVELGPVSERGRKMKMLHGRCGEIEDW
jgi:hypothetical protein